jgi:hypothetical protein
MIILFQIQEIYARGGRKYDPETGTYRAELSSSRYVVDPSEIHHTRGNTGYADALDCYGVTHDEKERLRYTYGCLPFYSHDETYYQLNGVYFIPDNTVVSKINFDDTPFYIPYTYVNITSRGPQGFKKHYEEIKVESAIDDKIKELEASIKNIQKQIEYFKKLKAE